MLYTLRMHVGSNLWLIIMLVLALSTFSCTNGNKNNNRTSIEKTPLESEPSNGQVLNKAAKNTDDDLLKRAKEYFQAIHDDNFDENKVKNYMYPGIFSYAKNNNQGHYYETDVTKTIGAPVWKLKRMVQEANASYRTDVGEIGKRINSSDKKVYFLKYSMTITKGMNSYTISDQILGVSLGKYDEWTFIEANKTAQEILKSEFTYQEMNQMMREIETL